jgi:hypothetical protein
VCPHLASSLPISNLCSICSQASSDEEAPSFKASFNPPLGASADFQVNAISFTKELVEELKKKFPNKKFIIHGSPDCR